MFQYAFASILAAKGFDVKLDISTYDTYHLHGGYQLDKYNISLKTADKTEIQKLRTNSLLTTILNRFGIFQKTVIKEKKLLFNPAFLHPNDHAYFDGYFQSEKYFLSIRNILIKSFTLKSTLSVEAQQIKKVIEASGVSISLHVRRGDYINNSTTNKIHGTCPLDYYQNAMSLLNEKYDEIQYFVFSDDIAWVKKNLPIENAVYVSKEGNRIPHEDIYLMSQCKHNVIANSTFSWWGAWLNNNPQKTVIAPERWFATQKMQLQATDIIPNNWITL